MLPIACERRPCENRHCQTFEAYTPTHPFKSCLLEDLAAVVLIEMDECVNVQVSIVGNLICVSHVCLSSCLIVFLVTIRFFFLNVMVPESSKVGGGFLIQIFCDANFFAEVF